MGDPATKGFVGLVAAGIVLLSGTITVVANALNRKRTIEEVKLVNLGLAPKAAAEAVK